MLLELLEKTERQEETESQAILALQEQMLDRRTSTPSRRTSASTVRHPRQDHLVHQDLQDQMEYQEHRASTVLRDDQVSKVHLDHKGHQETQEKMENQVHLDNLGKFELCPLPKGNLVHLGSRGHRGHLDQTDILATPVDLVRQDLKEKTDQMENQGATDLTGRLENLARMDPLALVTTALFLALRQDTELILILIRSTRPALRAF